MTSYHVVLIETASNQRYIFQSNKLREVLGASELVRRAGTTFVGDARPRDADGQVKNTVKTYVMTSGKAVLLFEKKAEAEDFVYRVTLRALKEAPGLGVFGAISDKTIDLQDASAEDASTLMVGLFEKIGRNRLRLADPGFRFPAQPIVAPCRTSGLPAESFSDETDVEISEMALAKREAAKIAIERLKNHVFGAMTLADPDAMEELGWVGVAHADGNGFGQIFMNLHKYVDHYIEKSEPHTASYYFSFYRDLSLALDEIGQAATVEATGLLKPNKKGEISMIPLVMGGDDLTVIVDGKQAVSFVQDYARAFERYVDENKIISKLVEPVRQDGADRQKLTFGVGAGIAIVKPHHPFHRAYDLAEELIRSAKKTKPILGPGASSLDFHIAFGDSSSSLKALREAWDKGADRLTARPYVLSKADRFAGRTDEQKAWGERHALSTLDTARKTLAGKKEQDGEERLLFPRSQQHVLRDAIFEGRAAADARLGLISHRYQDTDFSTFGDGTSLFFVETEKDETLHRTRLLDAMEMNDVCGEPKAPPAAAADETGSAAA